MNPGLRRRSERAKERLQRMMGVSKSKITTTYRFLNSPKRQVGYIADGRMPRHIEQLANHTSGPVMALGGPSPVPEDPVQPSSAEFFRCGEKRICGGGAKTRHP
jgi:hypothetical protein